MKTNERLIQLFSKFPGIGERQAKRFVYYILQSSPNFAHELAEMITKVRTEMKRCPETFHFFIPSQPEQQFSPFVTDTERNHEMVIVVEKDTDLEAIEKAGIYKGQYFVLGGLVPMIDTQTNPFMRTDALLAYIQKNQNVLKEIIFALPVNPEGERTRYVMTEKIKELQYNHIIISTFAQGLSTGAEPEYTDAYTLKNAFEHRYNPQ